MTSIGSYAFTYCSTIVSISIPDSVTNIADRAFANCDNLTSVTIPNSVTSIGIGAFAECNYVIITVGHDSYAKQYCIENGLNYTYSDSLDWLND